MRIETIEINGHTIWILIDQLRTYSHDKRLVETKTEFLCYYKLTEPNTFNYGELIKDVKGIPIIFKTPEEAIKYADSELSRRMK